MIIGIDVSQIVYQTGVGNYLKELVDHLLEIDKKNNYIFFASSLRQNKKLHKLALTYTQKNITWKIFTMPPTMLDLLWNKLHILPIEWLIGKIDVFLSSDWTQPPTRAKKATILYDLVVYKYPKETAQKIVEVHKRRLLWVKKECDIIFCISEATRKDARELLDISENKLAVIYPGR